MATSVAQDDVGEINEDKPTVPIHEGDLSNYKSEDNGQLDKTEGDGVGIGLDGGADAKGSGIEFILNESSTESANKKKRKNKKKKRNNKVGASDSGGLGENHENLVAKDSDDVSVGSLTTEPDVGTVVNEEKQAIFEQEIEENKDKEPTGESDDVSVKSHSSEPDVETVVREIERKQANSQQEIGLKEVENEDQEPTEGTAFVDESKPFSQIQDEKGELKLVESLENQTQELDVPGLVSETGKNQRLNGLTDDPEYELDYSKIISLSAVNRAKEPKQGGIEDELIETEPEMKEVVQENIIGTTEKSEESESHSGDTKSTAAFDITLQPSVKFIFQSDGNSQIDGLSESSTHLTESESALAVELNAASRSGSHDAHVQESARTTDESLKQGPSENILKTGLDDSDGDQSEDNSSQFCDSNDPILTNPNYFQELQEQYAWTQVDTSHIQPDDIFNNNYLRSDSQDFENRWEKECYLSQESDTSIKMPTVPNPSLDNIQLSPSEQNLATSAPEPTGPSFGKRATDFLDNKVVWKEQYPNFVATVQFTVQGIVDTASSKIEALVNRCDENETTEEEVTAGLDLGFGLIRESGSKTSDSMNNLYEVEGDPEYASRYGTQPSEYLTYEPPADELESLNGETVKVKKVSFEELTEGELGRKPSQGFLVNESPEESNEEDFYEILNNSDSDGDEWASQNWPTGGLRLTQLEEEFKSTTQSDDFESEVNEVFYDAKSNSSSQYQSTCTSPREPRLTELVVEETLDASFNSKVQYFELEVQKVALSVSQQCLQGPSRTFGLLDAIRQTSRDKNLLAQTNVPYEDVETRNGNKFPNVGTSSSTEFLTGDRITEFASHSVGEKKGNEVNTIDVLVPNQSTQKAKRLEGGNYLSKYWDARYNEGRDWSEYVLTPEDMLPPRALTFEELVVKLRLKPENPVEEVQQTHEVSLGEVPQNLEAPFSILPRTHENRSEPVGHTNEVPLEEIPLTNEIPFEEVQQKYERPLANERKCGSLKRAVPCFFPQSPVSAPTSELDIMNSDLDGTQDKTGSLLRKSGEHKPATAGTSGFNSSDGKGSYGRSLEHEGRQERGGTLERLRKWKTQSLKRFSKPNQ